MAFHSTRCLTRIVVDESARLDVAQIQAVMSRIQTALKDVPQAERAYIANALLNLAVAKVVNEEGERGAASILMRLGDVLTSSEPCPPPSRAINLSVKNA